MKKNLLKKIDPSSTGKLKEKHLVIEATEKLLQEMYDQLYLMFAEDKRSLLIVLQGIDASGKDGVVRHLFSGANPQGIRVHSFKQPSQEELKHDFLWRCHKVIPESGFAAIFNRSYYEEVTTLKVHPELLQSQHLPDEVTKDPKFFEKRYHNINAFEKMLTQNGVIVLKFFLHISKDEQENRLKERIEDSKKNWKFSILDIQERSYWNKYQKVFDEMLTATDTSYAPWYVIPANKKWFRDLAVSEITRAVLEDMEPRFPNPVGDLSKIVVK